MANKRPVRRLNSKMKWWIPFFILGVASAQLELAEPCDPEACQLPDCRCSSTNIPGGLAARDTPQFVLLTFDDAVNVINIETYRRLLDGRRNSNQCPIGTTFYVNHEYTNYVAVNELYNKGHEIALHSITHRTDQDFWREASTEDMRREFGDQKAQMAHFANIPYNSIHGVRIPFLQMTGNASFEAMSEFGLTYDCSWPTINSINPGLWPYTLDYASTQDCVIPPCPSASIPGVWVLPMISWLDQTGIPCSMVDACFPPNTPPRDDEEAWFRFIVTNFERHYFGNRAPFGFYVHEWFISSNPAIEAALSRFIDMVNNLQDSFMVTSNEVIEWVKEPVPIDQYRARSCRSFTPTTCPAASCGPLHSTHNGLDYWMQICNVCPNTYPWINNPLGL